MKYLKKKERKHCPVVIWLLIVPVVVAAALILLHPEKAAVDVPQTEPVAISTEAAEVPVEVVMTEPTVKEYNIVELADGKIQTPYCTLHYPEGLAEYLLVANTSQKPYVLEFYAVMEGKQELRLFDIALGEGSGGNMGMVLTQEGQIPLQVTMYTLTTDERWSEGEIITVHAMQDVVNEMIDQLAPKIEEAQPEALNISQQPEDNGAVNNLEIETPYTTLYYPARWADVLSNVYDDSQNEGYKVHFYSRLEGRENQLLFTICFGGDEGQQLGAVMGSDEIPVSVSLTMGQPQLDGWDAAEIETVHSMQEAANHLVDRLPLLQ